MMRQEPEPRERISVHVLVVDSASAIPKRPRDVAVEVAVNDTVGTLVDTIRETSCCRGVMATETLLLTSVAFKPNTALNADASSYGECRVSHVYTTRDGSFRTRPARGVKGFARAFPPESGYEFKHTTLELGVDKRQRPDRSKTRDVLVAYVLPKDAKQLAVVNPTYHFDFKALAARADGEDRASPGPCVHSLGTRRPCRARHLPIDGVDADGLDAEEEHADQTQAGGTLSPSTTRIANALRKSRRTNRSRRRGGASPLAALSADLATRSRSSMRMRCS